MWITVITLCRRLWCQGQISLSRPCLQVFCDCFSFSVIIQPISLLVYNLYLCFYATYFSVIIQPRFTMFWSTHRFLIKILIIAGYYICLSIRGSTSVLFPIKNGIWYLLILECYIRYSWKILKFNKKYLLSVNRKVLVHF